MNRVEKTLAEYRKDFHEAYHREILPLLSGLETQRKSELSKLIFIETIIAVILGCAVIYVSQRNLAPDILIIVGILGLIALAVVPIYRNSKFSKLLKQRCMPHLTKTFGEIQWTSGIHGISSEELNRSDLFASFNRRSSDDSFEGEYKNVTFQITETELIHESGSGKRRTCVQIFKGIIISFASNKTIKNKTIIATRGDMNIRRKSGFALFIALLPVFANLITMPLSRTVLLVILAVAVLLVIIGFKFSGSKEKMNEIKLEDPVFGKRFKVYSSDEVEARYLVTTAFMERFNNLNTAFGAKKAKCSFYDENIMFAISTNKNLFEIGDIFHRLDDPKKITEFFNEISSVLTLVDYFKLNEHTGL